MGLVFVPITLIATSGVPADDAGLASGLFNTSQQIGGALGLAAPLDVRDEQDHRHALVARPPADGRRPVGRRSSTGSTSPGSAARSCSPSARCCSSPFCAVATSSRWPEGEVAPVRRVGGSPPRRRRQPPAALDDVVERVAEREREGTARAPRPRRATTPPRSAETGSTGRGSTRTGSSSRSPFEPSPPPRTTSETSVTAATGTTCRAIRRATSWTTASASASPARAAAKMSRAPYGAHSVVGRPVAHQPRCVRRDSSRARVDVLDEPDEGEIDLSRRRRCDRGEARRGGRVLRPCPCRSTGTGSRRRRRQPPPLLPERREIDVVLEPDPTPSWASSASANVGPSRPATLVASEISRRSGSTTPGTPTTTPFTSASSRPVASTSAACSSAICSSTRDASAPSISTSRRALTSPRRSQIAPRRKRPPTSSPSASAASGTGSKNTAP